MPNMRKIDLEVETLVKPKREITEAQREHLNKIRLLAMAKKAELKEITLKSKLAKTVPKQGIKINNLFLVKIGCNQMPKICNKLYINKKQKKGKIKLISISG